MSEPALGESVVRLLARLDAEQLFQPLDFQTTRAVRDVQAAIDGPPCACMLREKAVALGLPLDFFIAGSRVPDRLELEGRRPFGPAPRPCSFVSGRDITMLVLRREVAALPCTRSGCLCSRAVA